MKAILKKPQKNVPLPTHNPFLPARINEKNKLLQKLLNILNNRLYKDDVKNSLFNSYFQKLMYLIKQEQSGISTGVQTNAMLNATMQTTPTNHDTSTIVNDESFLTATPDEFNDIPDLETSFETNIPIDQKFQFQDTPLTNVGNDFKTPENIPQNNKLLYSSLSGSIKNTKLLKPKTSVGRKRIIPVSLKKIKTPLNPHRTRQKHMRMTGEYNIALKKMIPKKIK
jgi:hypothetical protein